jgi:hypothetical protein
MQNVVLQEVEDSQTQVGNPNHDKTIDPLKVKQVGRVPLPAIALQVTQSGFCP